MTHRSGLPLTLLYAALFFELGINLPFFPLWLRSQALDDAAIGIVLAVPLVLRIVANPAVTALADRTGRLRGTLIACAVAVSIGTALFGLASGFAAIIAVVTLVALAQGPLIALTDALTLRILRDRDTAGRDYGRIRMWGSLAFAAASLGAGWVLTVLAPWSIIALLSAAAAATAVAALLVPAPPVAGVTDACPPAPGAGPAVAPVGLAMLAAAVAGPALIQASHAAVYAFSTLHWQTQGLSSPVVGALWATGIIGEVAVFAIAGRLAVGERGALALLAAGGLAAIARWLGMALDPSLPVLVALQLGHGLSFGATHLGSVFLLMRLVDDRQSAQAQGWLAAVWALAMAILTNLSGQLSATWGQAIYLPMAAAAAIGLALVAGVALARMRPIAGPV
ncbi:MAG: MFS transporter [Alsobacter sp.]